jgi:hypothetical protein
VATAKAIIAFGVLPAMCSIDRVAILLPRLSSALLAGEALFF